MRCRISALEQWSRHDTFLDISDKWCRSNLYLKYLSLNAECTGNGTHLWSIAPNVPNACITLSNFFQGAPVQGMIQVTNINTCIVGSLIVTHRFSCPNSTVHIVTQTLPIQDEGIFIGKDATTTPLTDYNCVLPGALYNGACTVYSSGIVTVDKAFTFSSANVRIEPGLSGFDVIKNFTLDQNTVVSGNAEADCNCLWRGINVYGTNTMTTDTDASIQDALYAIRVGYKSTLSIKKTLFVRNYIGIRSTEGGFNLIAFEENRFDGQGPLKNICSLDPLNDIVVAGLAFYTCGTAVPYQPGKGFAGMYLRDAGSVSLPALTFAKQNLFYDLAVGIDAKDTELSITRNSRFKDIVPLPSLYDIPYGGIGIRYVDSENKGVNGFHMIGNGKHFAGSPDFDNCIFGIYLSSSVPATVNSGTRIEVTSCRILGAHIGVFLSDNCGPGVFTGIFPKGGIGDNYIEVNPGTGQLYSIDLSGIVLTDFNDFQCAPEFWKNTIDVNQDVPCGAYGIRASGLLLPGQTLDQVNINKNQINVNQGAYGISLGTYSNAWVHDNSDAAFPGAGIFLNYAHLPEDCGGAMWDFSTGISVVSGVNNLVGCNDVTSLPDENHGLIVGGHTNGTFVRNYLEGGRFSTRFSFPNGGTTRFACNTMSNYFENGLHYHNGATTGDQGTSFTMTHGNVWVNSNPALTDAFINLGNTIPGSSRYFVRNIAGENPTTNTMPNAWFNANVPNTIEPTCYYECPISAPQFFVSEPTSVDSAVASEMSYYNYYPEAARWIHERNLLEKLALNPSLSMDNAFMGEFLDDRQNTAMAGLVSVNNNIDNLFALSETQKNGLESNANATTMLLTQLNYLDSVACAGLSLSVLETNRDERDSLAAALDEVRAASDSLARSLKQQWLDGVPAVLAELEGIVPTNVYESNEQYVLKIYLHTLNSGNQVSAAAIDSLLNIGRECPMVNGPCVYNARSLYHKFTGIFLPEIDCPELEERTSEQFRHQYKSSGVSLCPNPANDALMVKLPDNAEIGNYHLSITNLLGVVVVNTQIHPVEHQVSTGPLPNGAYFVRIVQNGIELLTTGILIQH